MGICHFYCYNQATTPTKRSMALIINENSHAFVKERSAWVFTNFLSCTHCVISLALYFTVSGKLLDPYLVKKITVLRSASPLNDSFKRLSFMLTDYSTSHHNHASSSLLHCTWYLLCTRQEGDRPATYANIH
jgi:hypothetical protein